jgi:hypothetical protein
MAAQLAASREVFSSMKFVNSKTTTMAGKRNFEHILCAQNLYLNKGAYQK